MLRLFRERTKELIAQISKEEISGSLGDLGTFIPLVVALARDRLIYLAPALFFSGVSNVITGYVWDVPMCVQPMKSIAAVALGGDLTREEVTAAGILTGGLILIIGVTGLIEIVNKIIPFSVVSGMQVGLGLKLAGKGMKDISDLPWIEDLDCILLAISCSGLCLYWLREPNSSSSNDDSQSLPSTNSDQCEKQRTFLHEIFSRRSMRTDDKDRKKTAVGIYLFLIAALFATIELITTKNEEKQYELPLRFFGASVAVNAVEQIEANNWKTGFLEGAIPQIPLTTLNSVISVCCLAHSLYPEKRKRKDGENTVRESDAVVTRKEVAVSVGLMNIFLCPFGCIPNCHGAGGLAGQHSLGARGGLSVIFLGVCKVLLSVFFGKSALTLLDAMPIAVLGVMLAIAGLELATTGLGMLVKQCQPHRLRQESVVALVTAAVILSLGKTHYGAISGWITYLIYSDGIEKFFAWFSAFRIEYYRKDKDAPEGEHPDTSSDGSQ